MRGLRAGPLVVERCRNAPPRPRPMPDRNPGPRRPPASLSVPRRPPLLRRRPRPDGQHQVVHRRQEPVLGAGVRQHLDLQEAGELETPIAFARTDAPERPLAELPFSRSSELKCRVSFAPMSRGTAPYAVPASPDPAKRQHQPLAVAASFDVSVLAQAHLALRRR